MIKQLLSYVLYAAASISALAQTVENPLPLVTGPNVYTFPELEETLTYYSYTPPVDEKVTISSGIRDFYISVIEDYRYNTTVYQWFYDASQETIFVAEAGKEYILANETEHASHAPGTQMNFTVESELGTSVWRESAPIPCS